MLCLPFSLMCLSDNDYLLPNFHMLNLYEATQQAFCYPQATSVLIFLIFVESINKYWKGWSIRLWNGPCNVPYSVRTTDHIQENKDPKIWINPLLHPKAMGKAMPHILDATWLLNLINRLHLNHLFPHVIILSLAGINSPKFCLSLAGIFLVLSLFRYQLLLKCRS